MTEYLQLIRRTARFLLATVLWLHAFFLLGLDLPSARPVATALRLQVGETNVLILLACASVLASYGFKNIFVDCLYIYTFPFIFTYYVARASFQTLAVVYRAFLKDEEEEPITSKSLRVGSTEKAEQPNSPRGTTVKGVLLAIIRPIRQFTLLWCLLLLLSANRVLQWIALIVVIVHLGRTLFALGVVALHSISWLSTVEERIRNYAERLIDKALAADQIRKDDQDLRVTWSGLRTIELAVSLLQNRTRAGNVALFILLLGFVAMYLYIAVLFSFAYFGLAKVQLVNLTWAESLVTSIFIPVSYSDLPRNAWLKLLGGVHWISVVALGFGTIYGYARGKLDS